MTKIINGYAQPDIEAQKGQQKRLIFVETPSSLKQNTEALQKSLVWLQRNEPNTIVGLVHTVPSARRNNEGIKA